MKRGYKAAGDYGVGDVFGLALAGAAGIIAAVVTDYQQQGESSALYTINQWVVSASRILGFGDVPLWAVVAGLVSFGAASVFYFQPLTRQGAFAQGFGLLAVMMTAVPGDLAGSLGTVGTDDLPELEPVTFQREAAVTGGIQNASYTINEARVYQAQHEVSAAAYHVHLFITFADGLPESLETMIRKGTLRGRLHNAQTGETYNIFRAAGGTLEQRGDTVIVHAGVPARADAATLWVRIECEGYTIEEQSAEARLGQPLDWAIDLRHSSAPLLLQRLRKSYWF
jgi:hypothetical protein